MFIPEPESSQSQSRAVRKPLKSRMKLAHENTGQDRFVPAGWFMMRLPILPFERWLSWTSAADSLAGDAMPQILHDQAQAIENRLRGGLRANLTPTVLEGLYLASSSLSGRLPHWIANPENPELRRVENSLVAYFSRLTGRPTPFGAFSAVQFGEFSNTARIRVPDASEYRRKTEIGLRYLRRLLQQILGPSAARKEIRYIANPTLWVSGGEAHYFKRVELANGTSAIHAAVCKAPLPLRRVLQALASGRTIDETARALLDDGSRSDLLDPSQPWLRKIYSFIEELISSQILLPVIGPALNTPDPAQPLIRQLSETPAWKPAADELKRISTDLQRVDAAGLGQPAQSYQELAGRLSSLCAGTEIADLFFVNVAVPKTSLLLPDHVAGEILEGAALLSALSRGNDPTWDRFAEAFNERFGVQPVPLLDLFEADFNFDFDKLPENGIAWQARDAHLLRRVTETLSRNEISLILSDEDIAQLRRKDPGECPACFAVLSTLVASSEADIASGKYQFLVEGITRAAGILSRFADLDQHWHDRITGLGEHEQELAGDAILADVLYDPPGEPASNVICRPALTRYCIPFFASSVSAEEFQIQLSDLYVSVQAGQVFLWSKRLNKRVVPVHNSAYAFHHAGNPPVLRFLCRLATGNSNVAWNWGEVLEALPFLPRLEHKRLILSRARWRISREELDAIGECSSASILNGIRDLRQVRRLPRYVSLLQKNRRLTVDLANVLSVRTFLGLTRGEPQVIVTEVLPGPEQLCVTGPQGRFQHELVIPAYTRSRRLSAVRNPFLRSRDQTAALSSGRLLPSSSDWLYLKIYTRRNWMDTVLLQAISPLVGELADAGIAQEWFFIRYTDPYSHLRLRLHLNHAAQAARAFAIIPARLGPVVDEGIAWKWQIDTYDRELERYGGEHGIRIAEKIFCADSVFALGYINRRSGLRVREEEWLPVAMLSIDRLLQDFNFDIQGRYQLLRELCDSFYPPEGHKNLKIALDNEFRATRSRIANALPGLHCDIADLLEQRSVAVRPQALALASSYAKKQLDVPASSFLKHCIHLSTNRIMKSPVKNLEIRLYGFLQKFYKSGVARGGRGLFDPGVSEPAATRLDALEDETVRI